MRERTKRCVSLIDNNRVTTDNNKQFGRPRVHDDVMVRVGDNVTTTIDLRVMHLNFHTIESRQFLKRSTG